MYYLHLIYHKEGEKNNIAPSSLQSEEMNNLDNKLYNEYTELVLHDKFIINSLKVTLNDSDL
ncbi:MAG: hypothetical protein HFJ48_05450 [Clostridia bacterium]|nr:hypothetical protein [Clostridia bacterium]